MKNRLVFCISIILSLFLLFDKTNGASIFSGNQTRILPRYVINQLPAKSAEDKTETKEESSDKSVYRYKNLVITIDPTRKILLTGKGEVELQEMVKIMAKHFDRFMQECRVGFSKLYGNCPPENKLKVIVHDEKEFQKLVGRKDVAAFFDRRTGVAHVLLPDTVGKERYEECVSAFTHEYSHCLIENLAESNKSKVNFFAHEGLATQLDPIPRQVDFLFTSITNRKNIEGQEAYFFVLITMTDEISSVVGIDFTQYSTLFSMYNYLLAKGLSFEKIIAYEKEKSEIFDKLVKKYSDEDFADLTSKERLMITDEYHKKMYSITERFIGKPFEEFIPEWRDFEKGLYKLLYDQSKKD